MLLRLLDAAGHRVEHVKDGLEAWDRLSRDLSAFDVLITDHAMPGLTGLELVELLRQTDYRGRIIVHSARLAQAETERYRAFKVDEILGKPIGPETMLRAVEGMTAA